MKKILTENKLVYIPAILPSPILYHKYKIKGIEPNFFTKDGVWNYNFALISAYHAKEMNEFKKEMKMEDTIFVLGDSGGFQAVTLGGKLNPVEVIEWQKKNCDAGLILDRPPYHFGGGAQFSGTPTKEFFEECLNETKNNARIMLERNEGENKIMLYGVVQGENWEQAVKWFDSMHELETGGREFNAWAVSPKPSLDEYKITLYGILMMEKQVKKPIHILQVSGKSGMIVSAYIRYLLQQPVTIDSSSHGISARYGLIIDPMNVPSTISIGEEARGKLKGVLCDCPICKKVEINFDNYDKNFDYFYNIHNLYQFQKFVEYLNCMTGDLEQYKAIARNCSEKCLKCIEILDYYKQNGLNKTKQKYKHVFEANQELKQNNIFQMM